MTIRIGKRLINTDLISVIGEYSTCQVYEAVLQAVLVKSETVLVIVMKDGEVLCVSNFEPGFQDYAEQLAGALRVRVQDEMSGECQREGRVIYPRNLRGLPLFHELRNVHTAEIWKVPPSIAEDLSWSPSIISWLKTDGSRTLHDPFEEQ